MNRYIVKNPWWIVNGRGLQNLCGRRSAASLPEEIRAIRAIRG
jgi:hypothetical protein